MSGHVGARTWDGPSAQERLALLRRTRSVALLGASDKPSRASYFVATYLLSSSSYRVHLVNPTLTSILGQPAYPDLASLPETPDLVSVFRRARGPARGPRPGARRGRPHAVAAARLLARGGGPTRRGGRARAW